MALTRQKKDSILKELIDQFKQTPAVIFVNFHGLNTAAVRQLRLFLRLSAGKYQVVKKTLIKKALGGLNILGDSPELQGEVGLVFGSRDNISEIAKKVAKFIKEHKELSVLGGLFEESFIDKKAVSSLAAIPSADVLLGKLVYVINAPVQRMVVALNGTVRNFVSVLSQIKK